MGAQLSALSDVTGVAQLPNYLPQEHGVGMVHIGVGAFHRAHQAVMTDDALAKHGGNWRIAGVSLRSKAIAAEMNAQNGLYTVLERAQASTTARVIASIDHVIADDPQATLAMLSNPEVRVVSLTVTEAGYGIDWEHRQPDTNNAVVSQDLAQPLKPVGVLGLLVASLYRRREHGIEPYTVLSCDNLPENGTLVREGVIGFARKAHGEEVAHWIEKNVAFPCTMVDRITPAPTSETYAEAARLTGCDDNAAIETEPFTQWIIEDNFPTGRPKWEAGGAIFVSDVTPYERMKLTMLNGSHSMLAYSGFLTGKQFVRDVMQDKHLAMLVRRHLESAAALLDPLPNITYSEYATELTERFTNPAIAHQTFQIASDGTQKLAQRIFQPAIEAHNTDELIRPFAFAAAMWMRFCLQQHDDGTGYELRDPRAVEIAQLLNGIEPEAFEISEAFHALPEFIPQKLRLNTFWRECIADVLSVALNEGCIAAIRHEAALTKSRLI